MTLQWISQNLLLLMMKWKLTLLAVREVSSALTTLLQIMMKMIPTHRLSLDHTREEE